MARFGQRGPGPDEEMQGFRPEMQGGPAPPVPLPATQALKGGGGKTGVGGGLGGGPNVTDHRYIPGPDFVPGGGQQGGAGSDPRLWGGQPPTTQPPNYIGGPPAGGPSPIGPDPRVPGGTPGQGGGGSLADQIKNRFMVDERDRSLSNLGDPANAQQGMDMWKQLINESGGNYDALLSEIGPTRMMDRFREYIGRSNWDEQSGIINIGNGQTLTSLRGVNPNPQRQPPAPISPGPFIPPPEFGGGPITAPPGGGGGGGGGGGVSFGGGPAQINFGGGGGGGPAPINFGGGPERIGSTTLPPFQGGPRDLATGVALQGGPMTGGLEALPPEFRGGGPGFQGGPQTGGLSPRPGTGNVYSGPTPEGVSTGGPGFRPPRRLGGPDIMPPTGGPSPRPGGGPDIMPPTGGVDPRPGGFQPPERMWQPEQQLGGGPDVIPPPEPQPGGGGGFQQQTEAALLDIMNNQGIPTDIMDSMRQSLRENLEGERQAGLDTIGEAMNRRGIGGAGVEASEMGQLQEALGAQQSQAMREAATGLGLGALDRRLQAALGGAEISTTQRGQDLAQALGLRGQDIDVRGQDLSQILGLRGQDVTQRGQDISRELGIGQIGATTRGQDITRELGLGNLNLGQRGQDIDRELGIGQIGATTRGQDIQRQIAEMQNALGFGQLGVQRELGQGDLALRNLTNSQNFANMLFNQNLSTAQFQNAVEQARLGNVNDLLSQFNSLIQGRQQGFY